MTSQVDSMGGEEEWGWCRATAETPPLTPLTLTSWVRCAAPHLVRPRLRCCPGGLALTSRYTSQDSVLAAERWSDCVRPGVSPQMG